MITHFPVTKVVERTLTESEVTDLVNVVKSSFGTDDVKVSVSYSTEGSLSFSATADVSDAEILEQLKSALAESLGVRPENIEVTLDRENGTATYKVLANDAESLVVLDDIVNSADFLSSTNAFLSNAGLSVSSVTAPGDVFVKLDITADSDTVLDLDGAIADAVGKIGNKGYTVDPPLVRFVSSSPTDVPSTTPSGSPVTSIPTAAPSFTGHVTLVLQHFVLLRS